MNEDEEEKFIVSITPDPVKPIGTARRNSEGKANTGTSLSLVGSDEKLLPRYLRASTGSCHDLCKYGRKHVIEVKKRHPKFSRYLNSNEISDKVQKEAKVATGHERRKRNEVKVKTAQPKDKLPDKPEVNKEKGPKETQLSDIPAILEDKFSADSASMKMMIPLPFQGRDTTLEHMPCTEGEESSKEPISIRMVTPLDHQLKELSEESITIKLEIPPPIEVSIAPTEFMPSALSEGSFDGSGSMDLETPIHTPVNQVEGSSEDSVGMELMMPLPVMESIILADEPNNMMLNSETSIENSLKSKNPPSAQKSAASAKLKPPPTEVNSSEKALSMELKYPSANQTSHAATKKQNQSNSLKMGEGKKRDDTKQKAAARMKSEASEKAKAIKAKKVEVNGEQNTPKNTPSPSKTISPIKPKILEHPSPSKTISPDKPKILEQKSQSAAKAITSGTLRATKKVSSPLERPGLPPKPLMSLEPKTPVVKSMSALPPSRMLTARSNLGNKMMKSTDLSKLAEAKILRPPRASLSPKPSVHSMKRQAKLREVEHTDEKVKEKTLYVVEPKAVKTYPKAINKNPKKNKLYSSSRTSSSTSSPSSSSSRSSRSSREKGQHGDNETTAGSEVSELALENKRTKRNKPVSPPKTEEKRRPRRTASFHSQDKNATPHKLTFRRGKVVSPPKSENSNAPRKLRFRQGKTASENQCKEVGKRSSRRRRGSGGSVTELITLNSETPAFVLRHQGVQGKKESQALLNDVIEETASKLVETRKSKVKALVSAFETVISLRDPKVTPSV